MVSPGPLRLNAKEVREALKNNCFYVYWTSHKTPDTKIRVIGVKSKGSILHVRLMSTGRYQSVDIQDKLELQ